MYIYICIHAYGSFSCALMRAYMKNPSLSVSPNRNPAGDRLFIFLQTVMLAHMRALQVSGTKLGAAEVRIHQSRSP